MSASGRRQQYAAATRAAIVVAARELFAERGFAATRVDDIAQRANVAPATVYTSVGGKQAVLLELIEQLFQWPQREENFAAIASAGTSGEVLAAVAAGTRADREAWADVIRVMEETAPHDSAVADARARRDEGLRGALDVVVGRLEALEGPAFDVAGARAALWFYFAPGAWASLHDDLRWSYPDAEQWLLQQCRQALNVGSPPPARLP